MEKALDGLYGNNWDTNDCMSAGYADTNSWAQVDLDLFYSIHTVKILNRGDRFGERLANFTVDIFDEDPSEFPATNRKLCAHYPGTVGTGQWVELTCDSHVVGRYVRVSKTQRYDSDLLCLCELEVYGDRVKGRGIQFMRLPSSRLSNAILSEQPAETVLNCLTLCYAESLCYGVNFKQPTGNSTSICQLVYNSLTNQITQEETSWNAHVVDSAGSRNLPTC
ncbi:fucolectin-like [Gigantopelta aegis]|uniref:fucolectin-like n=1 Tax=Gigantopelta aegis TaxID=1735272 RepID=UPI001B88BDB6|nr:fucolectin-like [Gigantopelta aegis]